MTILPRLGLVGFEPEPVSAKPLSHPRASLGYQKSVRLEKLNYMASQSEELCAKGPMLHKEGGLAMQASRKARD